MPPAAEVLKEWSSLMLKIEDEDDQGDEDDDNDQDEDVDEDEDEDGRSPRAERNQSCDTAQSKHSPCGWL